MQQIRTSLLAAITLVGPSLVFAQADGLDPAAEYEALLKQTTGLEVYNELVTRQIAAQQLDISNLQVAIEQVPELERQIPGLLTRMIDGLEQFISLDIPFRSEERAEGLAALRLIMERANVNDAEKFRRVLEAWQIENEYGSSFTTYVGQLQIDGTTREVDFLQVGRIALLYQTTDDAAMSGAWDPATESWTTLGSEHRNSVRRALQMARNQVAPELVLLPVPAPSAQ
jgi:hypothetical protein